MEKLWKTQRPMKINKIPLIIITCVILSFIFVSLLYWICPPKIIYVDEKKDECIEAGGIYYVRDFSYKHEGNEYMAICFIPEKRLWSIKIK